MASAKKTREYPDYFADSQSPEAMHRQFIIEPAQAAIQPGLALGKELLELMRVLPEAFRQSQERELARLKRQGKDAAPRVDSIQRSMAEAQALGELAERGQARADRVLVAMTRPERCFHGFVSDGDGKPLPGLVVRLGLAGREGGKFLEASTCDDGYFMIPLPSTGDKGRIDKRQHGGFEGSLEAALAALERGAATGTPSAAETVKDSVPGKIEIYSRDQKLLHADPAPVELASGSPYREYLVGGGTCPPAPIQTGPRDSGKPPPVATPAPEGKKRAKAATPKPAATRSTTTKTSARKKPK